MLVQIELLVLFNLVSVNTNLFLPKKGFAFSPYLLGLTIIPDTILMF